MRREGCALRLQRVWRGGRIRVRVGKLKGMTFDYVDDELDELLGEGDINLDEFGLEEGGAEEEGWMPRKPVIAVQEDAWRTPSGTPAVNTREGGMNAVTTEATEATIDTMGGMTEQEVRVAGGGAKAAGVASSELPNLYDKANPPTRLIARRRYRRLSVESGRRVAATWNS